jgi:type II secretory pathway component GspD/PulD (secretin)
MAVPICIGLAASPAAVAQAQTGATPAAAQSPVIRNFKDADITTLAEAVGAATGKNFIPVLLLYCHC